MTKTALGVSVGPKHVAHMGLMEHRSHAELIVHKAVKVTDNQFHMYLVTLPFVFDSLPVYLDANSYPKMACLRPDVKKGAKKNMILLEGYNQTR